MTDRYDYARSRKLPDQAVAITDKRRNDEQAKKAEQFVAEFLGLKWRERRVDGGVDLDFRGWMIDVKWSPLTPFRPMTRTKAYYACLRVPAWKPVRAQIFVAVHGSNRPFTNPDGVGISPTDEEAMKIYGFAFRREILEAPKLDFGYTNYRGDPATVYTVDLTDLHSREVLRALPAFDPERTPDDALSEAFASVEAGWRY